MTDDTRPSLSTFLRANVAPLVVMLVAVGIITGALAIVDPAIGTSVGLSILAAAILIHWLRNRPLDLTQRHSVGSVLMSGLIGAVGVLLIIQLVPYGRDHSNPAVAAEPNWDSPTTRELAVRACFDCHSNEVQWPWYSNIAPFSWATQFHVHEGRESVNFSEWNRSQHAADESAETIREGEMPPFYYTLTHSDARLNDAEKQQLITGLRASIGR